MCLSSGKPGKHGLCQDWLDPTPEQDLLFGEVHTLFFHMCCDSLLLQLSHEHPDWYVRSFGGWICRIAGDSGPEQPHPHANLVEWSMLELESDSSLSHWLRTNSMAPHKGTKQAAALDAFNLLLAGSGSSLFFHVSGVLFLTRAGSHNRNCHPQPWSTSINQLGGPRP